MRTAIDRKDAKDLLWAFGAMAVIPVAAWLSRPRPLAGSCLAALANAARTARQQTILDEMDRYSATSLNFDGPDPRPSIKARWKWVESELREAGAKPFQASAIAHRAQGEFSSYWPVLAERGYLRGHAVWLIIGSQNHGVQRGWICLPTAREIQSARIAGLCGDLKVVAISQQPPYYSLQ